MASCDDLVTNQDLADSKISSEYQKLWTSAVNEFEINPWTGLQNITFKGIEVAWDNQSQKIQDDADALIASLGGIDKGDYSSDPTIDLYSEYVVYDRAGATTGPELWKALPPRDGNPGTPLPYNIDSTTYPHPSNDPNLTPFSDITKEGAEKIAGDGDSQVAGSPIWPLNSQKSANSIPDDIPSGTELIRLSGGSFPDVTLFRLVNQAGGFDPVPSDGAYSNVNLSTIPYSIDIGSDSYYLIDDNHFYTQSISLDAFFPDSSGLTLSTIAVSTAAQWARLSGVKINQYGGTYLIDGEGTVDFTRVPLDLDCTLDFGSDTTGYIFIGGFANSTRNPDQYIRNIFDDESGGGVTNRTIDRPVAVIKGLKNNTTTINNASVVHLDPDESVPGNEETNSIAYCTFNFNYVQRLWLKGTSISVGQTSSWINENTFNLKRTRELIVGGGETPGVYYRHNNNIFNTGAFEGSGTKLDFKSAYSNTMYDLRFEGTDNDGTAIIFRENADRNSVYISWVSSQANDPVSETVYTDEGKGNVVASSNESAYQIYPAFYIGDGSLVLDNDATPTKYNIYGVGTWTGLGESDTPTATPYITKSGTTYTCPNNRVVCRTGLIPVSRTGDTWVLVSGEWVLNGYRYIIWGYDIDGNFLTPAAGDVFSSGVGEVEFGPMISVNRTTSSRAQVLREDCAFIVVSVYTAGGISEFKSANVAVRNPKSTVSTNVGDKRLASDYIVPFNTPNI